MNELIKNGTTWAEVIASFLLKKMHAEEEKYIKDRIKRLKWIVKRRLFQQCINKKLLQ
jgi:hypothetical protein